jgi:hypothetical protein
MTLGATFWKRMPGELPSFIRAGAGIVFGDANVVRSHDSIFRWEERFASRALLVDWNEGGSSWEGER